MNNVVKYGVGLAALGVAIYLVTKARKKSQSGAVGFAGAAGPGSRLAAISAAARRGAPQYACLCSCGAKIFLGPGETAADCPAKCRDRCN
jgi:hypothetical protein